MRARSISSGPKNAVLIAIVIAIMLVSKISTMVLICLVPDVAPLFTRPAGFMEVTIMTLGSMAAMVSIVKAFTWYGLEHFLFRLPELLQGLKILRMLMMVVLQRVCSLNFRFRELRSALIPITHISVLCL